MSRPLQARGRLAALSRHRSDDDPEVVEARRDLASVVLEEFITKHLEAAPPLTDRQRNHLAALVLAHPDNHR